MCTHKLLFSFVTCIANLPNLVKLLVSVSTNKLTNLHKQLKYLEERVQQGYPTDGSKDCHGRCYARRPNDSVLSTSSNLTDDLLPVVCPGLPQNAIHFMHVNTMPCISSSL